MLETWVEKHCPQTPILMCFWHQIDRRQNNENADQYLSLYHWLRLFSAKDFDDMHVINAEINTSWTKLQAEGSPLTYTFEKLRARKCIFFTVFPCQICTGLHEMYSYAPLTEREVEMAEFFCCVFMNRYEVEVHKNSKKAVRKAVKL